VDRGGRFSGSVITERATSKGRGWDRHQDLSASGSL
jgi:hypothetical protein